MKILGGLFFISLILASSTQLIDIANSSSDKSIIFARDMDNALECAFEGIDITKCSPEILNTSFEEELERFSDELKRINKEMREVAFTLEEENSIITNLDSSIAFLKLDESSANQARFSLVITEPELSIDQFYLGTEESKLIDLNNDDIEDLSITLENSSDSKVGLIFTESENPSGMLQVTAAAILDPNNIKRSAVVPHWILPIFFLALIITKKNYSKKK